MTAVSGFKSRGHVVFSAKWHLIWTPTGFCRFGTEHCRRSVLVDGVDVRLKEIIADVCVAFDAEMIEVEVMADHVYLLVAVLFPFAHGAGPPQTPIPKLMKVLKGRSSFLLRREFPRLRRSPSLWTRSYFCSTVGGAPLEVVRRNVGNQKLAG